MDKKDALLKLIEEDSRLTHGEIATMLDLDVAEVSSLIQNLEDENIIVGYHTIIDWDKTEDDTVSAMIEVSVIPQKGKGFDQIAAKIASFPEVESVYLMSGDYDISVEVKKAPMKVIAHFVAAKLATLESVQSTRTHVILQKYKTHGIDFDKYDEDKRQVVL